MAAKLSPTVVSTGPADELLANDGRGSTPQDTINKMSSEPNEESTEIGDAEQESKIQIAATKVESFIKKEIKKPSKSTDSATRNLENSLKTTLGNLFGDTKNDPSAKKAQDRAIAAYRDNRAGNNRLSIKDALGQSYETWDRTDQTKVAALSVSVGRILANVGQTGMVDQTGTYATVLGLLDKAVALGVPKLIDDLVTFVNTNKEAKRVLIQNTPSVIRRSDILTLNKILDIIGGDGVLKKVPNAPQVLLANYRFTVGTKPKHYLARRTELLAVLNRIKPTWSTKLRNGAAVADLSVTDGMSRDAKIVLSMVVAGTTDANYFAQAHMLEANMVRSYPVKSMSLLIGSMYPKMAYRG